MTGLVIKSTGKWYQVETPDGRILACRVRGKMRLSKLRTTNPIAVGDRVKLLDAPDEEGNYLITDYEERKNYLVRKSTNLSKQMQILAANVDQAYLLVTLRNPNTQLAFIDRFLVAAESFRIPVTLLFNKNDQYTADERIEVKKLMELYEAIGYPSFAISGNNPDDITFLQEKLRGQQVMISGHSGVGKSTLINSLDPEFDLRTGELSKAHHQGQHTTTFAEMFKLRYGGYIIDTPGIRAFGIVDLEKEVMSHYFPEMRALIGACKYHNCKHLNEPHCSVKAAVDSGEIALSRYLTYLQLMEEDQDEVYRKKVYG